MRMSAAAEQAIRDFERSMEDTRAKHGEKIEFFGRMLAEREEKGADMAEVDDLHWDLIADLKDELGSWAGGDDEADDETAEWVASNVSNEGWWTTAALALRRDGPDVAEEALRKILGMAPLTTEKEAALLEKVCSSSGRTCEKRRRMNG